MTWAVRGGTACTPCTSCAQAPKGSQPASNRPAQPEKRKIEKRRMVSTSGGLLLVEVHHRGCSDLRLVLHGEVGLDAVTENHRGQVAREAARQHVVFLYRLDVAVACHGNAIFGAFELYPQITETLIRLELGIAFADNHQPAQGAAQFALGGLKFTEGDRVVQRLGRHLN